MARNGRGSFADKLFSFPGALVIGTVIGTTMFWSRRREQPHYGPFNPTGSFQYGKSYPLWGGEGSVTYLITTTPTPGSWSLILSSRAGMTQHSDFSSENDARSAFASLKFRGEPVNNIFDQLGRFIPAAELSASVYDPKGKLVATLPAAQAEKSSGRP